LEVGGAVELADDVFVDVGEVAVGEVAVDLVGEVGGGEVGCEGVPVILFWSGDHRRGDYPLVGRDL